MQTTLILAAAIFLAVYVLARTLERGVVVLERRLATLHDALESLRLPSNRHTVATIAGILLAHRLEGSEYKKERDEARGAITPDKLVAEVSPALADAAAESRRAEVSELLLNREIKRCGALAIQLSRLTDRQLTSRDDALD